MCNVHIEYGLIIHQRNEKGNEVKRPLLIFYTFQYFFFRLENVLQRMHYMCDSIYTYTFSLDSYELAYAQQNTLRLTLISYDNMSVTKTRFVVRVK